MLQPLLSACFSASVHGGRVIREVVQEHVALDMVNKTEGQYDPQTVADRRSQQRIITALREAFPQLQIVGEEGELAPPASEDVVQCDLHALDAVEFEGGEEAQNRVLEWNNLVLWVDPLDGTKRFAAKKFDEVSVLIGITYKQRPIAGVVHLPFHGKHGVTYWGGPGIGVFRSEHDACEAQTTHSKWAKPSPMFPKRPLICTVSSTDCELVNSAMHQLAPATILTGGATGTMVLGVITGHSDAFFRFKAATRKWDICAVEPLIEALGGKITDTQGHVYVYDHIGNAPDFDNERGLLACIEPDALQVVLGVMTKVNLTSALDGREMTPQWFQECVFPGERVSRVHVVPDSVHRGKHSAVAKLEVHFDRSDSGSEGTERTAIVFLKKSARHELPARSEAYWKRDLASYRSETAFYAHFAGPLHTRGVELIRPLAVFQSDAVEHCSGNLVTSTGDESISSPENFMLLLECLGSASPMPSTFANYEAADCLELTETRQALNYLANLHASAWGQSELLVKAEKELWPAACWWAFPKRGEKELAQASEIWPQVLEHFQTYFEDESSDLPSSPELKSLGERMIEEAAYISSCLSVDESNTNSSLKTLVHGDFKSANLFFESASRKVVAFDWQWSGVGLGAMDVANLLNTSVTISLLANDESELELLQFYYKSLAERLHTLSVTPELQNSYPFEAFERHYMLATLEYARLLISNFWKRMTPQSCMSKASNGNCGLGYRSIPHVVRMVRKLHSGLTRVKMEHRKL
ncbi:hypothetical protein BBO99_00006813 [Phytophthora kernoviae]|uniref:3'(2'),5'-bisphosphate nucleotidase 1 n=1 Tax=Phytophthora kernoviae TaxID=325452 RepID=A0A3R7MK26_9STRA|nr:hypothetical protein BBI17_006831 [Phytophthora kernoviae]RLN77351.1 hypothetical protein BBO99_00006813 [Phytophthora kernoviae]